MEAAEPHRRHAGARPAHGRASTANWSPQAAAIPFAWDKEPNIESHDVAGVGDVWNDGAWDYSFTSLK